MSRVFKSVGGTVSKLATVAAGSIFVVNQCLYTVRPGYRALIFDRFQGVKQTTYEEGTHFKIPGIQNEVLVDVRTRPKSITTVTGTKDLQKVNLSLRVLAHPKYDELPQIYSNVGLNWQEKVLPSVANEVLKAIVAGYNADQLLTLRDQISREIRESLHNRCTQFNIVLDDVSITHLNFSRDFSKAIEDKQVAEQYAERAKFVVMKAEQEKLAQVIRAEGEGEAGALVSSAVKKHGNALIEIRRLETALQLATELSKSRGVTYLPSGGQNTLLQLPRSGPPPRR